MAGFLAHLAGRLGGSEGLLRPKIPSLFEPAPTVALDPTLAGGFPADEHRIVRTFERVDDVDQVIANAPPASERALPPPDPGARTAVLTPDSRAADRRTDFEPRAAHDNPETSVEPRGSRGSAAARPQTRPLSDLPAEGAPVSKANTAIRPASIVAGGPMATPRRVRPVDAAEQTDALPKRVPTTGTRTAIDNRESALEGVHGSAPEPGGILQAPVVARIVSAPLFSAPRAPESESTIHVTIGRVEVRAVTSPVSDGRRGERAPSPVMSLDEYLRTRAR
jgi:hypothetical protein